MPRVCAGCNRSRCHDSYSPSEWRKGPGVSKCTTCVDGQVSHNTLNRIRRSGSARYNGSYSGTVSVDDLDRPWAQGAFRWVAKGVYNSGPRQGELCVIKWFKSGAVFANAFFTYDIKAVDLALKIVERFNRRNFVSKVIKVNVPTVWSFTDSSPSRWAGQKVLCEPFIQNYQKFNSNSGWNDASTDWGKIMQALSHFSYHISGGDCVLCDLQGGVYQHEAVITDPAILTRDRDYGVTDLGQAGIVNFFSRHVCNRYCRSHWLKPGNPARCLNPVRGTAMVRHAAPTRRLRPAVTLSRD